MAIIISFHLEYKKTKVEIFNYAFIHCLKKKKVIENDLPQNYGLRRPPKEDQRQKTTKYSQGSKHVIKILENFLEY